MWFSLSPLGSVFLHCTIVTWPITWPKITSYSDCYWFRKEVLWPSILLKQPSEHWKQKDIVLCLEQQLSTWHWTTWCQSSAFWQQDFLFPLLRGKREKERFIQLGIWPEMKLATANELAKSMVPGSLKERIPRQNWNDNSLQNSSGYNSINHRAHLKHWFMVMLTKWKLIIRGHGRMFWNALKMNAIQWSPWN